MTEVRASLARIATAFAACQRLETRERFIPEEMTLAFVDAVDLAFRGGAGNALLAVAGLREAASAALSLAMTIRDAIDMTGRVVDDAGKGCSRPSRWRAIRKQAQAMRDSGDALALLPVLVSASLWSCLDRHVEPMPARRPRVDGYKELAEFVWWHRVQLDLPLPPALPENSSYETSARWSIAAAAWADSALASFESMPPLSRGSDVLAIVASGAQDIAHEFDLHSSFNKNLPTFDDRNMSYFGRFYFDLYRETQKVVIGGSRDLNKMRAFPKNITTAQAYDYIH